MANLNGDQNKSIKRWVPQIILFVLMIAVVTLAIITFTRPISQQAQTETSSPTQQALLTEEATLNVDLTPTPLVAIEPPTPENIGYTDGIIFWSTILVLIMLVGVLIETVRRRRS
ncbi:MAG: hypothetical protein ACK2TV_13625 [Anaerolineales bacterium]